MLEWLEVIGTFIIEHIQTFFQLFPLMFSFINGVGTFFVSAPGFMLPILELTLAVAVIMWIVNIF